MGGGALRVLVAYGTQNVILSGNPQMTYFYKTFKRYSHFAMENITIPLDGPNELNYDSTIQLRAKISRYGDLLSDMIFSFTLPDIYSKYNSAQTTTEIIISPGTGGGTLSLTIDKGLSFIVLNTTIRIISSTSAENYFDANVLSYSLETGDLLVDSATNITGTFTANVKYTIVPSKQWEFQWSRYIGAALIQNVSFSIGGQKIQEFDGSYLLSRALIDLDQDAFYKWSYLVGDVNDLTNPAKGAYSAPNSTYPNVVKTSLSSQINRPSIFGRDIHIPLMFWFTEATSQALPLVGLQYHECEVRITLNPISQLYTILDDAGYRVNPNNSTNGFLNLINNPQPGINTTDTNSPNYVTTTDINRQIRSFFVDFGYDAPPLNGWNLNPRIQGTYISLPKEEQEIFATRPLSYVIRQVTNFPFNLYTRSILDLQAHNPLTRLIFVERRSDWINRNDFANFTNWINPNASPQYPYSSTFSYTNPSGLLINTAQKDMIRSVRVLCDGNEIQEAKNSDYLSRYVPYKYTKGISQDGLLIYSFQLEQSAVQPSGSLNASRIKNLQVEVDVWPLPANTNYVYDLNIYAENINFLEIVSGMGGIKYAL